MKVAGLFFVALASAAFAAAAPATAPIPAEAGIAWSSKGSYIPGAAFEVSLTYTAGGEAVEIDTWRLGPAAFSVNGKQLGERAKGSMNLPAGGDLQLKFDLGPALAEVKIDGTFKLSLEGSETRDIGFFEPAPKGLNFMDPDSTPGGGLDSYQVLLSTNRGDMLVEMYPELAPNHVRNFLDLAYTGFYDGVLFHRVIPGFMIQGGDPNTKDITKKRMWGSGNGPRMLDAEFNSEKHVRGILSMARSQSPNSASCQFFIMHATAPGLDNEYSIFGKLVSGFDTLDQIATARTEPVAPGTTPAEPQEILSATVLYSPK